MNQPMTPHRSPVIVYVYTSTHIEFDRLTRILAPPESGKIQTQAWATVQTWTWTNKDRAYTKVQIFIHGNLAYESMKEGAHVTLAARWGGELCKRYFTQKTVRENFEAAIWTVPFKDDEIPFEVSEGRQTSALATTEEQQIPW